MIHLVIWALTGAEKRSVPTSTLIVAMKRLSLDPARALKIWAEILEIPDSTMMLLSFRLRQWKKMLNTKIPPAVVNFWKLIDLHLRTL